MDECHAFAQPLFAKEMALQTSFMTDNAARKVF